jgi:DNA-binding response OmpR family regulator
VRRWCDARDARPAFRRAIARVTADDRVRGLRAGGDDYLDGRAAIDQYWRG